MAVDGDDNIFVYLDRWRDDVVPDEVTHAVIDPSVKSVAHSSFWCREKLVSVIFHDGVEIIEEHAFRGCKSLPRIKLLGVREIGFEAFMNCSALSDVEFGDRLEYIGAGAFQYCESLRSIKLPSARSVRGWAFSNCVQLTDVEFGIDLETIGYSAFGNCDNLQHIAIPLKDNLFTFDSVERRYNQFFNCKNLTTVDIVGAEEINNTVSSLLLKRWKDEMNQEIGRINRELPSTDMNEKTDLIRLWIRSVINRMDRYKAEHTRLLKEHMTLLELAVWKANLDEKKENSTQKVQAKRAKIGEESKREEKRITSGADIIIKNVLPFLKLA